MESFWFFSIEEYKKRELNFYHYHIFLTLILDVLYFLKVCPIFDLQNQKDPKAYDFFIHTKLELSQAFSSLNSAKLNFFS